MNEYLGDYGMPVLPFSSKEIAENCPLTIEEDYFPSSDFVEKKERQEPWSAEEDSLLAEKVLSYIREGKKQIDAFQEVATLIGRTIGAAGIRWNSTVKDQHWFDLQNAKAERLKRKQELQQLFSSNRTRMDSWSKEEDQIVVDTVIQHIETAKTQLKAFEECSQKINRTVAAIGFRWNSELRHFYEEQIEKAKRKRIDVLAERVLNKKPKSIVSSVSESLPIHNEEEQEEYSPIQLAHLEMEHFQLQAKYRKLEEEKETLLERNRYLEQRLQEFEEKELFVSEDYNNFFRILEQARKLMIIK